MALRTGKETRGGASGPSPAIFDAFSILRACLGLAVMALLTAGSVFGLYAALALLTLAITADFSRRSFAGRLKRGEVLTRFVDPLCDSLYYLSVFLAFFINGWMPLWMLLTIYARNLITPYIQALACQLGSDLGVRQSDRMTTVAYSLVQVVVVAIALGAFGRRVTVNGYVCQGMLLVIAGLSLYSLKDYCGEAFKLLKSNGRR
jgi:phosphatidylglycerophosphate synthase